MNPIEHAFHAGVESERDWVAMKDNPVHDSDDSRAAEYLAAHPVTPSVDDIDVFRRFISSERNREASPQTCDALARLIEAWR